MSPEHTRIVGKYKTFDQAREIVDQFFVKYEPKFQMLAPDLITAWGKNPILERTPKGNLRFAIFIGLREEYEDLTPEEQKSLMGKSFKKLPVKYEVWNMVDAGKNQLFE